MPPNYTPRNIPGWLSENEGKLLAYFAGRARGPIVEIGSFQGKSTIYMALATKQKIYAVDPHLGETSSTSRPGQHNRFPKTLDTFKKNIKDFGVEENVVLLHKTSEQANKNWSKKIALLHIDGLHEYEYAKQDLQMWLPHLADDGVIVCHDAFAPYPEVWQAVYEEIFCKPGWGYVGVLDSQVFAIRGKPRFNWQRPFIVLATSVWHNQDLSEKLRFFIVNRLLKVFFLNKFMLAEIFGRMF